MPDQPVNAIPSGRASTQWWMILLGTAFLLTLTGCGMFNASGQIGPDLKPRFGTSVSVPLGK